MKKWAVGFLAFIAIGAVIAVFAFKVGVNPTPDVLPTIAVLPTDTATSTLTITPSPTVTSTATASATNTPTATLTPTDTPTLATLVLHITANDAQVSATLSPMPSATATPTMSPTYNVPSPPPQISTVAGAGVVPGWSRYTASNPDLQYTVGRWFLLKSTLASGGSYMYTADQTAMAVLPFDGAGIRIRYVAFPLFGVFEVHVDSQIIAVVDSYRARTAFMTTDVFGLTPGKHTLEIVNIGRKNAASGGYIIALDAVEIYQGPTSTPTASPSPTPTATFTPSPVMVQNIKLISGPPTIKPTNTPIPPTLVAASLVIAYDENGNNAIDPAEGVNGISVRLVKITTNEILASGFTNSDGYIRLQTMSDAPVRLVVPYFGKFWDLSSSGGGTEPRFTLILPPGNQPGLIP